MAAQWMTLRAALGLTVLMSLVAATLAGSVRDADAELGGPTPDTPALGHGH